MSIAKALLFSLILHVLITWAFGQVPSEWSTTPPPQISGVEVDIIDRAENKPLQQIVRDTPTPESQKNPDPKDPARFLSANTQRVWVETKAQKTGLTANRTKNNLAAEKTKTEKPPEPGEFANYKPVDFHKALQQEEGSSTVGEALPDNLAVGAFTALNTDQYQFYSFYSRVEELVRFRWETRVRTAIDMYDRRNLLNRIGNKNWISKMTFFLNAEGRLQKVRLTKESGIPAFDQAAIGAFQEVLIFPNPPREMIKEDGFIHLDYSFNVHFDPQTVAF